MTTSARQRLRVYSFEPLGAFGGMDVYDRSFHEALVANGGVDLTWVTSDRNAAAEVAYPTWMPFRRVFGTGSLAMQGIRYAAGLASLVRRASADARRGPTVIHQQFLTVPTLELAAVQAARSLGVPWVLTPHEALPYSSSRRDATVRRLLYSRAATLIALSETNRDEIAAVARVARDQVLLTRLAHFNDHRGDGATMDQTRARTHLGIAPDAPTILFLGEMRPIKGLDDLITAMPAVLEAIPNARLLIAGRPYRFDPNGPRQLAASLGISHAVSAHWRFLRDEELPIFHRAADVVALPYRAASQSGACYTAYAYERPVVASAVGGLTEQVVQGETGLLVPPRAPDSIASALVTLLRDRGRALRMGAHAHSWVARERPWEPVATETIAAYWHAWRRVGRTG